MRKALRRDDAAAPSRATERAAANGGPFLSFAGLAHERAGRRAVAVAEPPALSDVTMRIDA